MPRRRPGAALVTLLVSAALVVSTLAFAFASSRLKVSVSLSPSKPQGGPTIVMKAVITPPSTKGTVSFLVDNHTVGQVLHHGTRRVHHRISGAEYFTVTGLKVGKHHLQVVFDPARFGLRKVRSHRLTYTVIRVVPPPPPSPPPGADLQTIEVTVPPHPIHPSTKPSVLGIVKHRNNPSGTKPGRTPGGVLPFTGADVLILLLIAAALLLLGSWAIRVGSRKTGSSARVMAGLLGLAGIIGLAATLTQPERASAGSSQQIIQGSAAPARDDPPPGWRGAGPAIVASDAAGKILDVGKAIPVGEQVHITASGFAPYEVVSVSGQPAAADAAGVVTYDFRVTTSEDVVVRGKQLTSAWHITATPAP